jgi:hypothetical protein
LKSGSTLLVCHLDQYEASARKNDHQSKLTINMLEYEDKALRKAKKLHRMVLKTAEIGPHPYAM